MVYNKEAISHDEGMNLLGDISAIVSMIIRSLNLKDKTDVATVLCKAATYELQFQYHDNWDGSINYYILVFYFSFDDFVALSDRKNEYASIAFEALNEFYHEERDVIQNIAFNAQIAHYLNWNSLSTDVSKDDILVSLNSEMEMLIASGTGQIIIKGTDADAKYKDIYKRNSIWLKQLGLRLSRTYSNLWEWYNYYSHSLDSYQDRRVHIHSIYVPLINQIKESDDTRKHGVANAIITQLEDTMSSIRDISQQAFEEFGRAIKSIRDARESLSDERARKDAVRSIASAMEAVVKVLGGTDDIKTSSRILRDAYLWGPDEIVKEGDAIFNALHRLYPDLRHGSLEASTMSFDEAEYWIGKMINYVSYMRSRKSCTEMIE